MPEVEIQSLTEAERAALASSFAPPLRQRGMRNLVLSTLVILTAVVVFSIYGIERIPLAGMALFIVAVLVAEKVSYFLEIRSYRSLVRALSSRIQQLETGVDVDVAGEPSGTPSGPTA